MLNKNDRTTIDYIKTVSIRNIFLFRKDEDSKKKPQEKKAGNRHIYTL